MLCITHLPLAKICVIIIVGKEQDIRRAGEHIAGLKSNRHAPDGIGIFGVYKGVRVGVIKTHSKIATVFPDSNQNPVLRRKR